MPFNFTFPARRIFFRRGVFYRNVLCVLLASNAATASEWSVEPSVSLHEEYNDNIRFISDPHPKVWQTSLIPNLKFSSKTEVSEISGRGQLSINRYSGDATLNKTDQMFLLFASRMSERNTWSMNTSYIRDTTSELSTTGLVQPRTQRAALTINPSWTHSLTERLSLRLDYQYQDVSYDSTTSTNYKYRQGGPSLQYVWSERDKASVGIFYSRVDYAPSTVTSTIPTFFGPITDVTETDQKASTRGIQLDLNHLFSQTLTGSFSVGHRNVINTSSVTDTTSIGGSPIISGNVTTITHSNNYTLTGTLEKQYEAGLINGSISRDVNPSGSGLVNTNRYAVNLQKSFSENLSGSVSTAIYRTTYVATDAPGARYYTFEPKLSWRLSEWWTLDSGYRYARVEYDNTSTPITANAIYLNLSYSWPKIAVSR